MQHNHVNPDKFDGSIIVSTCKTNCKTVHNLSQDKLLNSFAITMFDQVIQLELKLYLPFVASWLLRLLSFIIILFIKLLGLCFTIILFIK